MGLNLKTKHEGLKVGIKKDGTPYSVRENRGRYFFPNEWNTFIEVVKKDKQILYDTLLQSGARIEEALHIRPKDFDWERKTLTLTVTKIKAKKKETSPRQRTFRISEKFARKIRKYISEKKLKEDEILFPTNKYNVYQMFRRALIKAGFEDYWNFGLHNIRKTTGNWLKALAVNSDEICLRLGHDHNTYLRHYGSATIFNETDRKEMVKILGEIY